jgi:very-short-patch-repair endonuclease
LRHDQIEAAGVSDDVIGRLLRDGTWRRVAWGIYAISDDCWAQQVWVGLLLGGPHAVVGGRAAAQLWHIPLDKPRYHAPEPPIDIYCGRAHNTLRSTDRWHFIRADRVSVGSPPRTSLASTIVDLSQTMDANQLAGLLGQCRNRVSSKQITEVLAGMGRHPQRALLLDIISDADDGVTSALERRYVRDVERAHRLPHAQRQAKPVGIYAVDNLYEDFGVIVELDSKAFHRGEAGGRDVERDRVHQSHGFYTLRYTWREVVDRSCRTADEVARVLAERGWTGHLVQCPRCREVWRRP